MATGRRGEGLDAGRAGFTQSDLAELKKAFRLLFLSRLGLNEAVAQVEAECTGRHIENLLAFVRSSERGICRRNTMLTAYCRNA